jgi:hypothetical protein
VVEAFVPPYPRAIPNSALGETNHLREGMALRGIGILDDGAIKWNVNSRDVASIDGLVMLIRTLDPTPISKGLDNEKAKDALSEGAMNRSNLSSSVL